MKKGWNHFLQTCVERPWWAGTVHDRRAVHLQETRHDIQLSLLTKEMSWQRRWKNWAQRLGATLVCATGSQVLWRHFLGHWGNSNKVIMIAVTKRRWAQCCDFYRHSNNAMELGESKVARYTVNCLIIQTWASTHTDDRLVMAVRSKKKLNDCVYCWPGLRKENGTSKEWNIGHC